MLVSVVRHADRTGSHVELDSKAYSMLHGSLFDLCVTLLKLALASVLFDCFDGITLKPISSLSGCPVSLLTGFPRSLYVVWLKWHFQLLIAAVSSRQEACDLYLQIPFLTTSFLALRRQGA